MSHPLKGYARALQKETGEGYVTCLNFVKEFIDMAKICRVDDSTEGTKKTLLAMWKSEKETP